VSEQCLTSHLRHNFSDESFQAISYTGADIQITTTKPREDTPKMQTLILIKWHYLTNKKAC